MKLLRFFWRLISHPIYLLIILSLLSLNTAVIFSSAVAMAISGLAQSIGVETVFARNTKAISRQKTQIKKQSAKLSKHKKVVADHTRRVSKRVVRGAGRNVASTFGEGIPVYGVAVIIGVTAWEIRDACDTMEDMKEINKAFDTDVDVQGDVDKVCGLDVPSIDEIKNAVYKSPGKAWDNFLNITEGIELPDFGKDPAAFLEFDWPDIDWEDLNPLNLLPQNPADGSEQGGDTQSDGN